MRFIKDEFDASKIVDTVFPIVEMAKKDKDESVVNATIGSLCDEEANLVAFESVFSNFNDLDNKIKAKYASAIVGDANYIKTIDEFVLENKIHLPHSIIATAGGTGAISITIANVLEKNDVLLIPDIAWGSYALMAKVNNLKVLKYNPYSVDDLIEKVNIISKTQKRVLLIVNSPCHNPLGLSISDDDWKRIIDHLNSLDTCVTLLNDIAYIDYSYNLKDVKNYMSYFNNINDNVMVVIAYSISKSFTAYGLRCGAAIIINKNQEDNILVYNSYEKMARAMWSNINNAAMVNFANVINNHKEEYLKEKAYYIDLLKQRSDLFIKEAKEVALPIYEYNEGFFITVKCKDDAKAKEIHTKLITNHIYTVLVSKGIRIGICSVPLNKVKGLAKRIKMVM